MRPLKPDALGTPKKDPATFVAGSETTYPENLKNFLKSQRPLRRKFLAVLPPCLVVSGMGMLSRFFERNPVLFFRSAGPRAVPLLDSGLYGHSSFWFFQNNEVGRCM